MARALHEPIPLRESSILGDFEESFTLAHVYGDLTQSPVLLKRLSPTEWFLADHAVQLLAGVQADGQDISGFEGFTSVADGVLWSGVRLAAPAPDGAVMTATCKGKLDRRTGALKKTAEAVMADFMRLAGRGWASPRLRAATDAIPIAGVLRERVAVRTALNRVIGSVGGWWTTDDAGLYPAPGAGLGVRLDSTNCTIDNIEASITNTASACRVEYGWSELDQGPLGAVRLTARGSRLDNQVTIAASWLLQAKDAEALGRRLLARLAGECLQVRAIVRGVSLRLGEWVTLQLPELAGALFITARTVEPGTDSTTIEGETYTSWSAIDFSSYSTRKPIAQDAAVEVAVRGKGVIFTVTDKSGKAVAGARVSLDGSAPGTTDAQGRMSFPITTPGQHVLAVEPPGGTPFELTVRT